MNMNNGMPGMPPMGMMGGPGMSISGKWYNKRTGRTIMVRDSYFDDTGMQVMTSDGQMINGDEFSRDYIQCDETIYDENGQSTGQSEAIDYDAMFSGMQSSTPEMNYATDTLLKQDAQVIKPTVQVVQQENNPALDKLFSKLDDFPTLDINIKWNKIPISELNMLKNIFDLTNDDIAEYIYNNYCTDVEIKKAISDAITRML
jgi:hypothetical protein